MYGSVNAVEHQHDQEEEEEEQNHPYDDDAVIGFYHEQWNQFDFPHNDMMLPQLTLLKDKK
jgi:hypothetical protein